jgi:hypothetical protein
LTLFFTKTQIHTRVNITKIVGMITSNLVENQ